VHFYDETTAENIGTTIPLNDHKKFFTRWVNKNGARYLLLKFIILNRLEIKFEDHLLSSTFHIF
jgi:hypothetical protein